MVLVPVQVVEVAALVILLAAQVEMAVSPVLVVGVADQPRLVLPVTAAPVPEAKSG